MKSPQQELLQALGRELLACAPAGARPVLVYAEIDEHSHGSSVFYPMPKGGGLVLEFGTTGLENALIAL